MSFHDAKKQSFPKQFDLLDEMTNFFKPKIEFENAHDKIDETILKQFTNTSNDL